MGQGQEHKVKAQPHIEILERGEVFFFYRPKVGREEAHSVDDVQRLYIVLRPESGESVIEEKQEPDSATKEGASASASVDKAAAHEGGHGSQQVNIEKQPLLRFMVMGRKSLPDNSTKSRPYWGFVEMVTTNIQDISTALKEEEYDTSTRGHRHVAAARPVGEGVYRILRHKYSSNRKSHTHLIYKLELPREDEKNEPQESLNIERESSFLIQIKNPDQRGSTSQSNYSGFRGLQNKRRAMFPAHLQAKFGHLRFSPADPPDFLNYEGCEFLLIYASDDIKDELGLELEGEAAAAGGGDEANPTCSDLLSSFDLGDTAPTSPLLRGTWA